MATKSDRENWDLYVRQELAAFYEFSGGVTYLWRNTPAADKLVARYGGDSELAVYSGPWHVIRRHLTSELAQWLEEERLLEHRLTLSEWVAQGRAERADLAFVDSASHTLGQLVEIRRVLAERDALIVEAARRGAARTDIARAVGITRQQVHVILARHDEAELALVSVNDPDEIF